MAEYCFTGYFENEVLRKRPYLRREWCIMRMAYYPETDSLYVDLSSKESVESQEVSPGVVLDYDAEGNPVGIDIDQASVKLDLSELVLDRIPATVAKLIA